MRRILLAPLAFLALLLPLTGSSLHEEHLDLEALVAGAERVAELRVLDRVCAVLPDGTIETRYQVALVTGLKGATAAVEELRLPGGEVGGHGLHLPGLPRFETGDRVVMFQSAPTPLKKSNRAPGRSGNSKRNSSSSVVPKLRPPTMCRTCSLAVSLSVMSMTG